MKKKGHLLEKNILLVSNYPSDTAYAWWLMEHFWCLLSNEVIDGGGDAFLAYPEITKVSATIADSSIKLVELPVVLASTRLKYFIQNNNVEIVYFTDRTYFSLLYLFLRKWGVCTIIIHDHTPGDRPPVKGVRRALKSLRNKIPLMTADAVLNVSELIRQRSMHNGCVPAAKTFTVQNGIPLIPLCKEIRTKQRVKLGVGDATTVIVTTGRAHPYKRFDFVIQVARLIEKQYPALDVKFFLVGDGPQLDELIKIVGDMNLTSMVHLLGYQSNVRELLQAGDLGFHASLGEAFSLSVVEYMSANLPVFVPDIPSVCQAVDHMENGCIYPWDDPEAAAIMLAKVVKDRNFVRKMGNSAREKATHEYSLEECSRQFLEISKLLIASR